MEQTIRKTLSEYAVEIEKDIQYEGLSEQDLINKWTSKVLSLSNEFRKENAKLTFKELYLETMLAIAKPGIDSKLFSAIPTGFTDLDRILKGLPKGDPSQTTSNPIQIRARLKRINIFIQRICAVDSLNPQK